MELKKSERNDFNILEELESLVIHNKLITPQAKGMAGIIIYKLRNDLPINEKEEHFYNDLLLFVNVPIK